MIPAAILNLRVNRDGVAGEAEVVARPLETAGLYWVDRAFAHRSAGASASSVNMEP